MNAPARGFGKPAARASGRIRPARPTDSAAILTLEELFPSDRMVMRSVRRFLASPNAHVWVAVLDGAVVGNLILLLRRGGRSARIYSVVVGPAARGLGLGARLVAAAESAARRLGRESISLEVREDNVPARSLYAKRGYVEVAHLPDYYDDGSDGLRLRKTF